ncbi:transposase [Streptomyces sp. NPDC006602]|uniref:IS110 family transposase n=1 Tax=Streptomyces sp. NPDC006602 TaxID=3364751 RepID=UPI0036BD7AD7
MAAATSRAHSALLELLADVLALSDEATWGIDVADGGAALGIAILRNHDQAVHCISSRAINRASESYRGEGKTDAKDAAVIANQIRVRHDLHLLHPGDETVSRSSPAAAPIGSPTAPAPSIASSPS